MSKLNSILIRTALCVAICVSASPLVFSQMAIFNIPTADTLEKTSVLVEADFIAKPAKYGNGGYQTYGYRVVYGLTHRTEIGANFYYTRDGGNAVSEMQLNAKQNFYRNEKHGFAVSGGILFSIPLRARRGEKRFGMVYGTASKEIGQTTITGGAYTILTNDKDFGTKNGVLFGIEQPIYKRLSFIGDWSSGNNRFGYAAAGLNFAITQRQYLTAGYNFGNYGRGNNALSVFYGYTF